MNINIDDVKLLMSESFDCALTGYIECKQDYIESIIENYFKNKKDTFENNVITVKNNELDNYYYYTYSTEMEKDFI